MTFLWIALGVAVEMGHLAFAFAVLAFGGLYLPRWAWKLLSGATLILQGVYMGCPLTQLASHFYALGGLPEHTGFMTLALGRAPGTTFSRSIWIALGMTLMVSAVRAGRRPLTAAAVRRSLVRRVSRARHAGRQSVTCVSA